MNKKKKCTRMQFSEDAVFSAGNVLTKCKNNRNSLDTGSGRIKV